MHFRQWKILVKISLKFVLKGPIDNNPALDESYPPSAAYMRQWIGSVLVQIMVCRLYGAKPLSKPMLGRQLDPWEQTSVIFFSFLIKARPLLPRFSYTLQVPWSLHASFDIGIRYHIESIRQRGQRDGLPGWQRHWCQVWQCVVIGHSEWLVVQHRRSGNKHIMINKRRPRQNGRHLAGVIFKCIFFNGNHCITKLTAISKRVHNDPLNNTSTLHKQLSCQRFDPA